MFLFGLAGGPYGFDPLILLVAALAVEALLGGLPSVFRGAGAPLRALRRLIEALERKLNREKRSPADRAVRGVLVTLFVVAAAGAVGWGVAWLGQNHPFGWPIEFIGVLLLIDQRQRHAQVGRVAQAIAAGDLEVARRELGRLVRRDPGLMDDFGVARAAVESAATGFVTGVVAPAFWYALFGFPGLAVYRVVAVMDATIGHQTPRYRAFGLAAARLDDVLELIPARLAGLFLVVAAVFVPAASPLRALGTMVREAGRHRSLNFGWPVAAMAGAVNVTLAGPRHYAGATVDDPWIGGGTARIVPRDMRRALYLYAVACLINGACVLALIVLRFDAII